METDKLFDILYSKKQILNHLRSTEEIKQAEIRAGYINSLMNNPVFDEHFLKKLSSNTPYSEIEDCYRFILQLIIERVPLFKEIKDRNYHIIVTGGINFRKESMDNEVAIILEWPIIKFLDLLNCNVIKSQSFEHYRENCVLVMSYYHRKYFHEENVNLFSSIYDISTFTPIQYQFNMLLQQIQTVFILSHELGHLLYPKLTGLAAEIAADRVAVESVIKYCKDNQKLKPIIISGIMLLFSYLTLLDVSIKDNKQKKISTRETWLDRYDSVMDQIEQIEVSEEDMILISGYDEICKILDEMCISDINNSNE